MTRISFCGLGQMGAPMANRLIDAGCELVVWNRTRERADPLVAKGARLASTPAEAAEEADAVITMLSTPEAVEDVLFGQNGVAAGIEPPATLIEMSTIGREAVFRTRDRLPHDVGMLDAPVLGSIPQATQGELKIFVGGDEERFRDWEPVLEHLGRPRHVGPLGSGAALKLVTNWCLGVLMVGLGEALALADALELPQSDVLDVLAESPIGPTVRSKRENIESDQWKARFKLSLAAKDLRLVSEAAERAGLDLALVAGIRARLEAAEAAGKGEADYSVVIEDIRGRRA